MRQILVRLEVTLVIVLEENLPWVDTLVGSKVTGRSPKSQGSTAFAVLVRKI
jgi:hypothetical protein